MATEKKRYSFVLYVNGYTSAMAKMSDRRKAEILDAIYAHVGNEHATMPRIDELLEAVLSPIFDGIAANAKKYEAKCKANRLAGSVGGKRRVANASERKRTLENQANASVSSRIKQNQAESSVFNHEYEYEYELTTTAKDNLLSNTKLCSIDNRPSETKRSLETLADGSERLQMLEDAWPPDYDPAEAFGGDLKDDSTEHDDQEIDRPF